MNNTLYRYEYAPNKYTKEEHTGILVGLDDIFDIDTSMKLSAFFDDNLQRPRDDLKGTMSFFTVKGNRKFSKAIRDIKKAAALKEVEVLTIKASRYNVTILYEDEYQVLIPRNYEGSTTIPEGSTLK